MLLFKLFPVSTVTKLGSKSKNCELGTYQTLKIQANLQISLFLATCRKINMEF